MKHVLAGLRLGLFSIFGIFSIFSLVGGVSQLAQAELADGAIIIRILPRTARSVSAWVGPRRSD